MTREAAVDALRVMVASLDRTDFDAAVARLLERISCRADALELRSCLVEEGARSLLRAATRGAHA